MTRRLDRLNPHQFLAGALLGSVACGMFAVSLALGQTFTTLTYFSVIVVLAWTIGFWWLYLQRHDRDESAGGD